MALGLVCHWVDEAGNNLLKASELRLGRLRAGGYSKEQVRNTYINNIKRHTAFIPHVIASGIRVFRLTSSLMTLADQVPRDWWDDEEISLALGEFGAVCINGGLRVTMHPGQFAVLSSDSDQVVANAIKDLEIHAWIMDQMGLPRSTFHAINVHGGKRSRSARLIQTIESLPPQIRNRLTLENDESSYAVTDLLEVYLETGTPIVLDSHHHSFNDGDLDLHVAHAACVDTWGSIKPLQHISNTEPGLEKLSFSDRRKHSNFIHTIPETQLGALLRDEIDVEVEAKMKNFALFKMSRDFSIPV